MDDDLVLNLAVDEQPLGKSKRNLTRGGRWTDRLKAKRTVKRKIRHDDKIPPDTGDEVGPPPAKRPRKDPLPHTRPTAERSSTVARPSAQIISSLFSSNPREQITLEPAPRLISQPSNAPLDSSTFSGLGLDPLLIAHLTAKMKVHKPTSIQKAALPALLGTASQSSLSRDVFIQSQTGSGKTLAFLLPIIQDLLPLSSLSWIDRSVGTLAVIIAPTRELAKQISDVLETLLKMRLRPEDDTAEDAASARMTRWLVSGLLTGGSTRAHEKARLRKGVPILVSTPGRLLDHLQNTSSFNVGKCRWLVLDEADRLMELGFEETIQGIVKGLDGRRGLALQAFREGTSQEPGGWDWDRRRRTILCSATIREDVQKLAGTTLANPLVVKATESDKPSGADLAARADGSTPMTVAASENFTPPSQLSQKYMVVPLKLRLVTLVALLRQLLGQAQNKRGCKIIVFLSCTDSVDFHWRLLGHSSMDREEEEEEAASDEEPENSGDEDPTAARGKASNKEVMEVRSSLLPDTSIFRLHGSLPQATRIASVRGFSAVPSAKSKTASPKPASFSILLCTSVASRGLDLPLVRAVVQYDLPTEGGATEYVHRVGRTARAGKGGEAWSFVTPSEVEWVKWVEGKMRGEHSGEDKPRIGLEGVPVDSVLKKGFGGRGTEHEERATEVQLVFERWVLRRPEDAALARKAFLSHMRAYATHPSDEKHIFHIRHLHIGHLAKAFALRDAPSSVTGKKGTSRPKAKAAARNRPARVGIDRARQRQAPDDEGDNEAEKRMKDAVRAQGRLNKKGGVMMSSGASEFQITMGKDLEKLAEGPRT